MDVSFTNYSETKVLAKRPPITKEMYRGVLKVLARKGVQDDVERVRFWGAVPELDGRFIRVITLSDQETIHNAFPDRRFKS